MRHHVFAAVELALGLGVLVWFVVLLAAPALVAAIADLPWLLRAPPRLPLPTFGLNPHLLAGSAVHPSVVVLVACAMLLVCYRWLTERRRR